MSLLTDWRARGFAKPPRREVAGPAGLMLYRAWGANSTELGTGYFSLEKPASVLDAELRFNIADWGNGVHFLSTFRLDAGTPYHVGPVAHGTRDLFRAGHQVYIEPLCMGAVHLVHSRALLLHDVTVVQRAGRA